VSCHVAPAPVDTSQLQSNVLQQLAEGGAALHIARAMDMGRHIQPRRGGGTILISRTQLRPALAALALLAAPASGEGKPLPLSEVVMEPDGNVLYSNSANLARPPASLAKMMTLYLLFDDLDAGKLRLTDGIRISRRAAAQDPSKLGIAVGRTISVRDAIGALAVKSANDVAVAIAEEVAGSESAFARRMTRKAKALGLRHTVFGNATGLPDRRTRTTAKDMALLSVALIRHHPRRYASFARRTFAWRGRVMPNHNQLLGRTPGVDGIKTGYTASARFTIAASAKRRGRRLVAVVMGSPTRQQRDARAKALLNAGFKVVERRAKGERIKRSSLLRRTDRR
jgi:D-alanyl-D-alanine carboxypeptidase